jgi:microcystin-dependent protein
MCPSGAEYEAALRGAILSLTEEVNWENVNGQDIDVVAAAFFEAYQVTLDWGRCMPIGTVFNFAGDAAPDGSLLCDGGSYDTGDYPLLFDAIGYIWGGSGSSFNVPDMRENFALGVGGGLSVGDTGGEQDHTLTEAEMPSHDHTLDQVLGVLGTAPPIPAWVPSVIPLASTNSTGGGNAHNNMPPYAALLACIVSQ